MKKILFLSFLFSLFSISYCDAAYTSEEKSAYTWAFNNGITSMSTIDEADMKGDVTRAQMAKMVTNYAKNVLGKTPDTTKSCLFLNSNITPDLVNYVIESCQLGLMGQGISDFRPNDYVSRAEFGTILSRMLYLTQDGNPYYITHLSKLKSEGIISNDNPNLQEKRGYVMLMLMRSNKTDITEKNAEPVKQEDINVNINENIVEDIKQEGSKSLVLYFSPTGNTKRIATFISEITSGDITEIIPEIPYTSEDLNYSDSETRATKEQNDSSARPEISSEISLDGYDTIYIGYPIWWGTNPKIILTLIEKYNFSGKEVVLFCTSGSSGIGTSENELKSHGLNIIGSKRFSASSSKEEVQNWIESL